MLSPTFKLNIIYIQKHIFKNFPPSAYNRAKSQQKSKRNATRLLIGQLLTLMNLKICHGSKKLSPHTHIHTHKKTSSLCLHSVGRYYGLKVLVTEVFLSIKLEALFFLFFPMLWFYRKKLRFPWSKKITKAKRSSIAVYNLRSRLHVPFVFNNDYYSHCTQEYMHVPR